MVAATNDLGRSAEPRRTSLLVAGLMISVVEQAAGGVLVVITGAAGDRMAVVDRMADGQVTVSLPERVEGGEGPTWALSVDGWGPLLMRLEGDTEPRTYRLAEMTE